jgi:hypothetical protein
MTAVATPARLRARVATRRGVTGAALVLLWAALVVPGEPAGLTAWALLRVPAEAVVLVALALVLPARGRRWWVGLAGGVLGVSAVLRIADIASLRVVARPFDLLSDWATLGPGIGVLADSVGRPLAVTGAVLVAALLAALPLVVAAAALRVTAVAVRRRSVVVPTVLVLTVAGVLGAAGGPPVASARAAGALSDEAAAIRAGLVDRSAFDEQLAVRDPAAGIPAGELLAGLRGKDVLVVFVESYGRDAVQGQGLSAQIRGDLDAGTRSLRAAGFSARSAFLTSPTFGGVSWLAHATLQSGLWVDNQRDYDQLLASRRSTLTALFGRAGWRTVVSSPSSTTPWPEGQRFYRFDAMYGTGDVGYAGPAFSYAKIPDQFTLEALQRRELAPAARRPVMAEVALVSSHSPWAPLPRLVPWADLGDGSVFRPMPAQGQDPKVVWGDRERMRAAYVASVRYSLGAVLSFVRTYGDDDLVLVVLGDHQPATRVTGDGVTHDVPVSVIARDRRVLDRIEPWQWHDGLLPGADAPLWRMDTFRDRFLAAYAGPAAGGPAP